MTQKKSFKTKLSIETLKVNSFITSVESSTKVQTGGGTYLCRVTQNYLSALCISCFCGTNNFETK